MPETKKHVHFIGICGVGIAPVAHMMLDLGWRVTGSDKGFFSPISDYLKQYPEIEFYPGWHPEKIGQPDLVVLGSFIGPQNKELQHVMEHQLPYKAWAEVLEEFVIKKNSIVVVGTYGKTTIAALLAWILEQANYEPSYMSAGILKNFPDGARSAKSNWSVVEGDEYLADRLKNRSKFFYYHPRYLILTAVEWDHMDVFKTEQEYIDNFSELILGMPPDGLIVAGHESQNLNTVLNKAQCKIARYDGLDSSGDGYKITEKIQVGDWTNFKIINEQKGFTEDFKTILIGNHMLENVCSAVALCNELGLPLDKVREAVASFEGVRRRLETRGKTESGAMVVDDLAHSPAKAKASLKALKDWYPETRLIVIYEPNIGARTEIGLENYDEAFAEAEEVIVPRLSLAKKIVGEKRLNGEELVEVIRRTHNSVRYLPNDEQLTDYLKRTTHEGHIIAFMGARGFRGMIEQILTPKS